MRCEGCIVLVDVGDLGGHCLFVIHAAGHFDAIEVLSHYDAAGVASLADVVVDVVCFDDVVSFDDVVNRVSDERI